MRKIFLAIIQYLKTRCWHDWQYDYSFAKYETLPGSKVFCETRAFTCKKCGQRDYGIYPSNEYGKN